MSQSTNDVIVASIKTETVTKSPSAIIITDSISPVHRLTLRDKYLRKTEYLLNVKGKEIAEALTRRVRSGQGQGAKTIQQQKEEQSLLERFQRTCKKLESRRDRVLSLTQNTLTSGYVLSKLQHSAIERKVPAATTLSSKRTDESPR